MLIIPYLFTILYALFCKPKKHLWVWCAFLVAIMMLTAQEYSDLRNYSNYYEAIVAGSWITGFEGISIGWTYLCKLFGLFHFSYRGMQVIIVFLCFYALHKVVKSINLRENIFWGLYLIYPLPIQCIQTRFYLGTVIAWVGFSYIIKNDPRRILKFMISITIATIIHSSCIIYVVLLFAVILKNTSLRKSVLFSVAAMGALYYFVGLVPDIASRFIVDSAYNRYFVNSITRTTLTGFIQVVLIWIGAIWIAVFHDVLARGNINNKDERMVLIKNIFTESTWIKGLLLLGITLPLMVYDNNFCRYVMCGITLAHLSFASEVRVKNKNNRLIVLLIYCVILLFAVFIYIPVDSILKPLFNISGIYSIFR